jgi:hypothetical protein
MSFEGQIPKPAVNQISKYHQFAANQVSRLRIDSINKSNGLVSAPIGESARSPILENSSAAKDQLYTMQNESPTKRGPFEAYQDSPL